MMTIYVGIILTVKIVKMRINNNFKTIIILYNHTTYIIMTEIETILITSSMLDTDLYNFFIKRTRLNLKFIRYNGIRYKIILGKDILDLLENRRREGILKNKISFLKNYNDRLIREIQQMNLKNKIDF